MPSHRPAPAGPSGTGRRGHVSADDILAHARTRYPAINPSTVYRTLDALVSAGIARRTDLGSERLFYEVARQHRHHHAVCERCGAVAHLHDASLSPLADALRTATGYELTSEREIVLVGAGLFAVVFAVTGPRRLRRKAGVGRPALAQNVTNR